MSESEKLNDWYIVYDDDGLPVTVCRKSHVGAIYRGKYGATVGCNIVVEGAIVFVPGVDVDVVFNDVIGIDNSTHSQWQRLDDAYQEARERFAPFFRKTDVAVSENKN